jgi:hypothetical protein
VHFRLAESDSILIVARNCQPAPRETLQADGQVKMLNRRVLGDRKPPKRSEMPNYQNDRECSGLVASFDLRGGEQMCIANFRTIRWADVLRGAWAGIERSRCHRRHGLSVEKILATML